MKMQKIWLLVILLSHDVLFCMQQNQQLTQQQKVFYCVCNQQTKTIKLTCHCRACVDCISNLALQKQIPTCPDCKQQCKDLLIEKFLHCPLCQKETQMPYYVRDYIQDSDTFRILEKNNLIKESRYQKDLDWWSHKIFICLFLSSIAIGVLMLLLLSLGLPCSIRKEIIRVGGILFILPWFLMLFGSSYFLFRRDIGNAWDKYWEKV